MSDYRMPEIVCDAINDMKSPTESMAIINYIDILTACIRELEEKLDEAMAERDEAIEERDGYMSELIHLENV